MRERPSRVPGAIVWSSRPAREEYRVLPDGCMDIIWATDGSLVVAGPDTTAFLTSGTPGSTMTGIRFAPGFAPKLLRAPAHELRDRHEPLDAVMPARAAHRLADALAATDEPANVLEALALDVDGDDEMSVVAEGARRGEPVSVIAATVGLSERHLHRRCLDAFGYGAKTLTRILRMNRALDLVHGGAPYVDAAVTAGYADQSHLARDVKALAGVPLGQLVPDAAYRSTPLPSGSSTVA